MRSLQLQLRPESLVSEANAPDASNVWNLSSLLEHLIRHHAGRRFGMFVHPDDANRAVDAAFRITAEREVRDVHLMAAEQRADIADDARLVVVLDHEQCPIERRFDANAVDKHEPKAAVREHGALNPTLA